MQCENDYFLWVLYWNVGTNYSWWWHSPFYISVSEGSTALKWAAPDMQMYRHFLGDHSFSGCVKFSENLTLLNLWYHMCAYQGVRHVSFSGKNCICNISNEWPLGKIYIGVHATCNDSVKIRKNSAQKMKFSIRIYSVNVIKSTENCGFGQIYGRNP